MGDAMPLMSPRCDRRNAPLEDGGARLNRVFGKADELLPPSLRYFLFTIARNPSSRFFMSALP